MLMAFPLTKLLSSSRKHRGEGGGSGGELRNMRRLHGGFSTEVSLIGGTGLSKFGKMNIILHL